MKIQILLLLIFFSVALFAQKDTFKTHKKELMQNNPVVVLSKQEMYADFDTLVAIIERNDTQLEARKIVTGFDNLAYIKNQRSKIDTISNPFIFAVFINDCIKSLNDRHAYIKGHAYMKYHSMWPRKMRKTIDDTAFGRTLHYEDYFKMYCYGNKIEFKYLNHIYYLRYPVDIFSNGQKTVLYQGTKITTINNRSIDDYIGDYAKTDNAAIWNKKDGKLLSESLPTKGCWHVKSIGYIDEHSINKTIIVDSLKVFDYQEQLYQIFINQNQDKQYNNFYIQEDSVLYFRIPSMQEYYSKNYLDELKQYKNHSFKKIIFDIRDNVGGSDFVWIDILENTIDTTINFEVVQAINPQSDALKLGSFSKRKIKKFEEKKIQFLNNQEVLLLDDGKEEYKAKSKSLRFDGEIIILKNENTYSAASCFSSMAKLNDNITSIGSNSGRILGRGMNPTTFVLPHSKIIYQLHTLIDLTNATSARDVYQDDVEVELDLPIDYYIYRANHPEEVYTKEYLLNEDVFFEQVLEYIRKQ